MANTPLFMMKRSIDYLVHGLLVVACLTLMLLATWDRPETTALGGILLGGAFILLAVVGLCRKWETASFLDLVVFSFLGYMFWRASCSEVAMYMRSDVFLLLIVTGIWLLRAYLQNNIEKWKLLWISVILVSLIANLAACVVQLSVDPSWGLFIQRSESASRYVSGVFSHYNYMANFCMVSAISVLGVVFTSKSKVLWRVIAGLVCVGNVSLLAMAHSRGAFVASILGLAVFIFVALLVAQTGPSRLRGKSAVLSVGLAFAALLGGVLWVSYLGESRGWLTNGNEIMDNGRTEIAALSIDQFLSSPIYGDGAHSFEWRSIELWPDQLTQRLGTLDYVHNEYLQLLAEYGLVGLVLFLLCFSGVILENIHGLFIKKDARVDALWRAAILAAIIAFSVQSFFSFTAHIPALILTVVFLVVLGRHVQSSKRMVFVLVQNSLLLACGSLMMWMSLKELPAFFLHTKSNETLEVDYSDQQSKLDVDIKELGEIVKLAPNHQRYERLGLLSAKASKFTSDSELKNLYLEQSLDAFEKAVKLYPKSPMHRVNYARMLVSSGRGAEAEGHFEHVITHAMNREFWTNAHLHYAEYCFKRGNELWFQRRTNEAYFYYLKSQRLSKGAHRNRFSKEITKLLKKRIELLKSTGFEPKGPTAKEVL